MKTVCQQDLVCGTWSHSYHHTREPPLDHRDTVSVTIAKTLPDRFFLCLGVVAHSKAPYTIFFFFLVSHCYIAFAVTGRLSSLPETNARPSSLLGCYISFLSWEEKQMALVTGSMYHSMKSCKEVLLISTLLSYK